MKNPQAYGLSVSLNVDYEEAARRVRDELAREGFGVLTEIDVAATLRKKLDIDFRPYVILGACNPALAHRGLVAERDLGLLLPCNVVVYAADEPGHSVVAAMDPDVALALTGNEQVTEVAREAKARLERVLERLSSGAAGG